MKKLFSAFTAVLLAFCFISCAPQELSDRSSKNEGSVSLSIRSPRTISPAEGISYKDVQTWTVTFKDRTAQYDDIIVKDVNFNATPSKEIRLPIGTYNVTLNGTADNSTSEEPATAQPVPFYGEASVTVKKDEIIPISVFVAPKQSGTGSFNFTVTTSGEFGNYTPVVSGNYFTVSLTPYGGEKPTATWTPTPTEISGSVIETGSSYLFSVSSETLESKSVPSGFYTLSIKYTWVVGTDSDGNSLTKTKEIFYPYHDFLVEIIDGLTTTGSADITVSLEKSKTYYATIGTSNGNGAFASMPKNFDALLEEIDSSVSFVNIYMVDENENEIITAPAIARWVINKHTLEVTARINPEYLEWFSEVVNQYILFNLRDFVKLKSKYSMILFLELSTFWNTGMYYKRINDLREILGVNPTRNNRDFINNVLKPAIAALKEYFPELSLTVEKNSSDSRKITHVRLKFDKLTITDMQERLRSSEGASLVEYQQELENMEGEEKAVNDPTPEIDLSNVEW